MALSVGLVRLFPLRKTPRIFAGATVVADVPEGHNIMNTGTDSTATHNYVPGKSIPVFQVPGSMIIRWEL
jgi:hypothetical protein